MTRLFKGALLLVISVLLLSACSANIEEEQKATNDKVANAFKSALKKANEKADDIRFYLPEGYNVKDKSPNNIILKNGSLQYILFYNPQEGAESKVVYNATISNSDEFQYKKTYKKDDQFGYLLIKELDDNLQEVTVGVGGVKITTELKTKNMKNEAEVMMQIVRSVKKIENDKTKK